MESSKQENILKKHGLRITNTRKSILNIFNNSDCAITQQDIEDSIDNLDRITLYRTLKSFENKGIIHRAVDGTDKVKYAMCEELCDEHHHEHHHVHFHCQKCEQTYCVDEIEIPAMKVPEGYQVTSTNIIMNGTCNNCQ